MSEAGTSSLDGRQGEALVSLHVDDLGMCHGANAAFLALARAGKVDCGSAMVPCPWFSEIAEAAAGDPGLDVGVHLTLTAEKRHCRWRPLTGASRACGLVDHDGYFWRSVPELLAAAEPQAVEAELRAQIEAALAAGIDVTHLDDHMGAVFAPRFVEIYIRLGREFRLPILFPRTMAAFGPLHNFTSFDDAPHRERARRLEAAGHLLAERVLETPWHRDAPVEARYRPLIEAVGAGFSFFALHPNAPGEIEAIEPATAAIRIEEFELLSGDAFAAALAAKGARRTGMRALRDVLRRSATRPAIAR